MFRVLRGEMVKADLTIVRLAEELGMSEKSLRNKLNGTTEFSWNEVLKIRKIVAPTMSLEELFKAA
ncbi:MAG: transcriptional regulator [Lachnospiraceae bacterium]